MSSDRNDEFLDNGVSTFTLTDDEGNEYEFELLDFVDLDEKLYAVLIPSSPDRCKRGRWYCNNGDNFRTE